MDNQFPGLAWISDPIRLGFYYHNVAIDHRIGSSLLVVTMTNNTMSNN